MLLDYISQRGDGEIVVLIILAFIFIRFLKGILSPPKRRRPKRRVRGRRPKRRVRGRRPKRRSYKIGKVFLPASIKSKADRKYSKLLSKFRRGHKRKPSNNDLFMTVVTASHHTYPVKGKNSRRWMRGKGGHWLRQRVRKYLSEKHGIVENYIMK
jgi:hypothetical protein